LSRLGSPNFQQIPINRPLAPVHNNQRDGHMRQTIDVGQASYNPNTTGNGCPFQAKAKEGGFVSYNERIDARKIRARSQSFFDHFSQATLFYNSQSAAEKKHLISALTFELGKLKMPAIQTRVVGMLTQIDKTLAANVAQGLGIAVPEKPEEPMNLSVPADGNPQDFEPTKKVSSLKISKALSMENTAKKTIKTRRIAILAADGVDDTALNVLKKALDTEGAVTQIVAPHLGFITAENGTKIKVDQSFLTTDSVLFDAVYVPNGQKSTLTLKNEPNSISFINDAYKHCKAIAADGTATDFLQQTVIGKMGKDDKNAAANGVLINRNVKEFIAAIAQHRFWQREK
jgi:catalase